MSGLQKYIFNMLKRLVRYKRFSLKQGKNKDIFGKKNLEERILWPRESFLSVLISTICFNMILKLILILILEIHFSRDM